MTITVYSTSTCGICHALMKWLDEKGISYRAVEVDTDPAGMEALLHASGGAIGVPFTTVERDGETLKIQGFDRRQLETALDG